jgi:hypothetical protein
MICIGQTLKPPCHLPAAAPGCQSAWMAVLLRIDYRMAVVAFSTLGGV